MNYNKIIKDLKRENDSLKNQYQLMQIRAVSGEFKQQRIDKAIEFIIKHKWHYSLENDYQILLCEEDINRLLKILKGE